MTRSTEGYYLVKGRYDDLNKDTTVIKEGSIVFTTDEKGLYLCDGKVSDKKKISDLVLISSIKNVPESDRYPNKLYYSLNEQNIYGYDSTTMKFVPLSKYENDIIEVKQPFSPISIGDDNGFMKYVSLPANTLSVHRIGSIIKNDSNQYGIVYQIEDNADYQRVTILSFTKSGSGGGGGETVEFEGTVEHNTRYVDSNYSGDVINGSFERPYKNLEAALSDLEFISLENANVTIVLKPNSVVQYPNITNTSSWNINSLTIQGNGSVIKCNGDTLVFKLGSSLTIENCTLSKDLDGVINITPILTTTRPANWTSTFINLNNVIINRNCNLYAPNINLFNVKLGNKVKDNKIILYNEKLDDTWVSGDYNSKLLIDSCNLINVKINNPNNSNLTIKNTLLQDFIDDEYGDVINFNELTLLSGGLYNTSDKIYNIVAKSYAINGFSFGNRNVVIKNNNNDIIVDNLGNVSNPSTIGLDARTIHYNKDMQYSNTKYSIADHLDAINTKINKPNAFTVDDHNNIYNTDGAHNINDEAINSFVVGTENTVNGINSVIEGQHHQDDANSTHVHIEGVNNRVVQCTDGDGGVVAQHIQGQYNDYTTTEVPLIDVIGYGTNDAERKNLYTMDITGDSNFYGNMSIGTTNEPKEINISGNTTVGGDTTINGDTALNKNVTIDGSVTIDGKTTINNNITVGGNIIQTIIDPESGETIEKEIATKDYVEHEIANASVPYFGTYVGTGGVNNTIRQIDLGFAPKCVIIWNRGYIQSGANTVVIYGGIAAYGHPVKSIQHPKYNIIECTDTGFNLFNYTSGGDSQVNVNKKDEEYYFLAFRDINFLPDIQ